MAGVQKRAKKSKKNRKHGRNVDYCKSYAARHQQEKNQLKRLRKHLDRFPDDAAAKAAVARLK